MISICLRFLTILADNEYHGELIIYYMARFSLVWKDKLKHYKEPSQTSELCMNVFNFVKNFWLIKWMNTSWPFTEWPLKMSLSFAPLTELPVSYYSDLFLGLAILPYVWICFLVSIVNERLAWKNIHQRTAKQIMWLRWWTFKPFYHADFQTHVFPAKDKLLQITFSRNIGERLREHPV